jgi:hypothetical protein
MAARIFSGGFTIEVLSAQMRDGLATATPDIVHAGKRKVQVARVRITDAGRRMIAGRVGQRTIQPGEVYGASTGCHRHRPGRHRDPQHRVRTE